MKLLAKADKNVGNYNHLGRKYISYKSVPSFVFLTKSLLVFSVQFTNKHQANARNKYPSHKCLFVKYSLKDISVLSHFSSAFNIYSLLLTSANIKVSSAQKPTGKKKQKKRVNTPLLTWPVVRQKTVLPVTAWLPVCDLWKALEARVNGLSNLCDKNSFCSITSSYLRSLLHHFSRVQSMRGPNEVTSCSSISPGQLYQTNKIYQSHILRPILETAISTSWTCMHMN